MTGDIEMKSAVKFADAKVHTSHLKHLLDTICGDVVSSWKFIDGYKVSKVTIHYRDDRLYDDWGAPALYVSSCHSRHRRYLDLLEQIGKSETLHYDTLSELMLLMTLRGC